MELKAGHFYHIAKRGNNHQKIFLDKSYYLKFIKKLKDSLTEHSDILCYCLMPNHFHLMIRIKDDEQASRSFKNKYSTMLSSYSQWFGWKNNSSGALFKKRSLQKEISEPDYLLHCFLYIHQNPLRARMINQLSEWPFSSYPDYAGLRNGSLCNRKLALSLLNLPESYDQFQKISYQTIDDKYLKFMRKPS